MIRPTKVRELLLQQSTSKKRAPHLAAASGLVCIGNSLYVVADDEHHLGVFSASDSAPGDLIRLFDGTLPEKYKKRKAEKPDLETLTTLPPFEGYPHGALLALGSGSTPNRETGVLLELDSRGRALASPRRIDLSALYDDLRLQLESINIEGAVVLGNDFYLFQRGNKGSANALIRCELNPFLNDFAKGDAPRLNRAADIHVVELGDIDGVPLCFTDGAALPNGKLLFTAAAEDADNSVDDGPFKGSAIGIVNASCKVERLENLDPAYKVEGVTAELGAGGIRVRLVTDGDDASMPAWLLTAVLPW